MASPLCITFWSTHLYAKYDTFKVVNTDILFLHKVFLLLVYNIFSSQFDNNLTPITCTGNLYACLILGIQLWAMKIDIFFNQIWCPEKMDNLEKFCSRRNKILAGILMFLVFLSHAFSTCGKGKLVLVRY